MNKQQITKVHFWRNLQQTSSNQNNQMAMTIAQIMVRKNLHPFRRTRERY